MKKLTNTVTTHYVVCANCQNDIHEYNRMLEIKETVTQKWNCRHCGWDNTITFEKGEVVSVELTGEKITRAIGLMTSDQEGGDPIYLYIDVVIYPHHMKNGVLTFDNELAESMAFYYDTHTCPVNWIKGDVNKIIHEDDADPHGLFKLIGLWELNAFRELVHVDDDETHVMIKNYTARLYAVEEKVVITLPTSTSL